MKTVISMSATSPKTSTSASMNSFKLSQKIDFKDEDYPQAIESLIPMFEKTLKELGKSLDAVKASAKAHKYQVARTQALKLYAKLAGAL